MRFAIVGRHPAMRAGIGALLAPADDVEVVPGIGADHHELAHALYRTAPDIVMGEDAPPRSPAALACASAGK